MFWESALRQQREGIFLTEVVHWCCCGIDVHKKLIAACLIQGGKREVREFGTMTMEIQDLVNWLTGAGCERIAMESTGIYWKPLYNLFTKKLSRL